MDIQQLKSARDNMVSILETMTERGKAEVRAGYDISERDRRFINEAFGAVKELTEIIEKSEVVSNV